jgi:hypothetical protein
MDVRIGHCDQAPPARTLEVEPEGPLSGSVAARALRQHGSQGTELRIADVRLGRRSAIWT